MSITYSRYRTALTEPIIRPRFKLYTLYPDFSINMDISEYMIQGGSLSISYQNGCRRTASIPLMMTDEIRLNSNGDIWLNTLFRLDLGMEIDGEEIYFQGGVFIQKKPSMATNFSEAKFTLDLVDLYALFDGTISGTIGSDYFIERGTLVRTAITTILQSVGITMTPIIANTYMNKTITGDIRCAAGKNLSDIIEEIVKYCSGVFYFDATGRFHVDEGQFDLSDSTKGSEYDFNTDKLGYQGCTVTINKEKIINQVVVDGNSIDSGIADIAIHAVATNNDPTSEFCVKRMSLNPRIPVPITKYVSDNHITTQEEVTDRANYELRYNTILNKSYNFPSPYICDLREGTIVTLTDEKLKFDHERVLITGITIPLSTECKMSIQGSNTNEVNYQIVMNLNS